MLSLETKQQQSYSYIQDKIGTGKFKSYLRFKSFRHIKYDLDKPTYNLSMGVPRKRDILPEVKVNLPKI